MSTGPWKQTKKLLNARIAAATLRADALAYDLETAKRQIASLSTQLADCCPELTIRKAALLGLLFGGALGFVAAWVMESTL